MTNPVAASAADISPWRKAFADAAKQIPIIGEPLATLILDPQIGGLVARSLLGAAAALLIYPLVLVLAVSWLLQSSWFPKELKNYVGREVRQAFSVGDEARLINEDEQKRLDYYQFVDMRESVSSNQTFTLRIQPYQRLVIRPVLVDFSSQNPKECPLQASLDRSPVFALKVGNIYVQPSMRRSHAEQPAIEISHKQWKELVTAREDLLEFQLVPAPELAEDMRKALQCPSVVTSVRLAVEVFKSYVKEAK